MVTFQRLLVESGPAWLQLSLLYIPNTHREPARR